MNALNVIAIGIVLSGFGVSLYVLVTDQNWRHKEADDAE